MGGEGTIADSAAADRKAEADLRLLQTWVSSLQNGHYESRRLRLSPELLGSFLVISGLEGR